MSKDRNIAITKTCAECPWRRDVPVGNFPPERFKALRRTCQQGLGHAMFACHKTPDGQEKACAGFLLVEGHNNFNVRIAQVRGTIDMDKVQATGPLYDSFAEMARANGYDPDDDADEADEW